MTLLNSRQPCLRYPEFGGKLPLRLPSLTPRLSNEIPKVLGATNFLILAHRGTKNDIRFNVKRNDIRSDVKVTGI